jgi:hypothetical protein
MRSQPRAPRSIIVARNPAAVTVASLANMLTTAGVSERSAPATSSGSGRGGRSRSRVRTKVSQPAATKSAASYSQPAVNAGAMMPTTPNVMGVIMASR